MPEVILPCPRCKSTDLVAWNFVVCKDCEMRGPRDVDESAAIAAWNALPRALTWTHEPPVVAGWYWMRQQGEIFDLIQHYNQADIDGGFDNERRLKQWSGPIPEPKEPT